MDTATEEMGASLQARLAEFPNRRTISAANSAQSNPTVVELPGHTAASLDADSRDLAPAGAQAEMAAPERPANFADLGHLLEQRCRKWVAAARNLEQRRRHLAFLQAEQDLACAQLGRIVPAVQESYRSLKEAIDARQTGEAGKSVEESAAMNARALDELEELAGAISARAAWHRTAWEDYMQAAESARSLRATSDGRR
jgi:hypothetical protein